MFRGFDPAFGSLFRLGASRARTQNLFLPGDNEALLLKDSESLHPLVDPLELPDVISVLLGIERDWHVISVFISFHIMSFQVQFLLFSAFLQFFDPDSDTATLGVKKNGLSGIILLMDVNVNDENALLASDYELISHLVKVHKVDQAQSLWHLLLLYQVHVLIEYVKFHVLTACEIQVMVSTIAQGCDLRNLQT